MHQLLYLDEMSSRLFPSMHPPSIEELRCEWQSEARNVSGSSLRLHLRESSSSADEIRQGESSVEEREGEDRTERHMLASMEALLTSISDELKAPSIDFSSHDGRDGANASAPSSMDGRKSNSSNLLTLGAFSRH